MRVGMSVVWPKDLEERLGVGFNNPREWNVCGGAARSKQDFAGCSGSHGGGPRGDSRAYSLPNRRVERGVHYQLDATPTYVPLPSMKGRIDRMKGTDTAI